MDSGIREKNEVRAAFTVAGISLPNLFIAGAPKCGTSALALALGQHPDIFLPRFKEPQYFASDFQRRIIADTQSYAAQYKGANAFRYRLDATVTYLCSSEAVKNIVSAVPDAKFILVFRDPLAMVPSWHSEMLVDLSEDEQSLETAWDLVDDRRRGRVPIPKRCPHPPFLYYDQIAAYAEQFARLLAYVPKERVVVLDFDELVADSAQALATITRFLGLENRDEIRLEMANSRQQWRSRHIAILLRTPLMQRLKRRLVGVGRFSAFAPLVFAPKQRETLTDTMRAKLVACYSSDRDRLELMLGKSLSHWLRPTE